MSYLKSCKNTKEDSLGVNYAIQWRSTKGTVRLSNGVVFYKRYSKLGELISADKESEKYFIACAIRAERNVPDYVNLHYEAL